MIIATLPLNRGEAVLLLRVMLEWHFATCRTGPLTRYTEDNCRVMQELIDRLWIPVLMDT